MVLWDGVEALTATRFLPFDLNSIGLEGLGTERALVKLLLHDLCFPLLLPPFQLLPFELTVSIKQMVDLVPASISLSLAFVLIGGVSAQEGLR